MSQFDAAKIYGLNEKETENLRKMWAESGEMCSFNRYVERVAPRLDMRRVEARLKERT